MSQFHENLQEDGWKGIPYSEDPSRHGGSPKNPYSGSQVTGF